MPPTAIAVLRLLAALGAAPGDELMLDPELPDTLGCTERALRKALALLDADGVLTWHRKRPGRPARPGYPVTILEEVTA